MELFVRGVTAVIVFAQKRITKYLNHLCLSNRIHFVFIYGLWTIYTWCEVYAGATCTVFTSQTTQAWLQTYTQWSGHYAWLANVLTVKLKDSTYCFLTLIVLECKLHESIRVRLVKSKYPKKKGKKCRDQSKYVENKLDLSVLVPSIYLYLSIIIVILHFENIEFKCWQVLSWNVENMCQA